MIDLSFLTPTTSEAYFPVGNGTSGWRRRRFRTTYLLRMVHAGLRIWTRIHHFFLSCAFLLSRVRRNPLRRPLRSSGVHRSLMRNLLRLRPVMRPVTLDLPRSTILPGFGAFHVLVNLIASFSFEPALIIIQISLLRRCILLGLRVGRFLLRHSILSTIHFFG